MCSASQAIDGSRASAGMDQLLVAVLEIGLMRLDQLHGTHAPVASMTGAVGRQSGCNGYADQAILAKIAYERDSLIEFGRSNDVRSVQSLPAAGKAISSSV